MADNGGGLTAGVATVTTSGAEAVQTTENDIYEDMQCAQSHNTTYCEKEA